MQKHFLEEVLEKPATGHKAAAVIDTQAAEIANPDYQYAHQHKYPDGKVLKNIAILKVDSDNPFPENQDINVVQFILVGEAALNILSSVLVMFTNKLNVGAVSQTNADPHQPLGISEILTELEGKIDDLSNLIKAVKSVPKDKDNFAGELAHHLQSILPKKKILNVLGINTDKIEKEIGHLLGAFLKESFSIVFGPLIRGLLKEVGLYGQAKSIEQYAEQFQTMVTPDSMATAFTDGGFSRLPVAGPNPLVIERVVGTLTEKLPVIESDYKAVMGNDDSITLAIAENRLYITDYKALASLEPGQFPVPKFTSAPIVLFAIKQGDSSGSLQPVAIQLGQVGGASNPIFYPHDNAWEMAKLHVQTADGNYHELISHLGLTHLLMEPFAVSTHRMLPVEHKIFQLLQPHFQGTLFINNAAVNTLINPEGTVDSILSGTIESDWNVVTTALGCLNFNDHMLPNQLAARHVDDAKLPLAYPYRDDALSVWNATSNWVKEYISIYYKSDLEVAADISIQGWLNDLISSDGGCINGLGQTLTGSKIDISKLNTSQWNMHKLGIYDRDYLREVLTMVIFTASTQHAAVNFPQQSVMSYTPAMPLACYQEPPLAPTDSISTDDMLSTLPPLQQAFQQLVIGQLLGGVYFTRLGDYDRHQRGHYFVDASAQKAAADFRVALSKVETEIGQRNLKRAHYNTLLPSRIPQSINI